MIRQLSFSLLIIGIFLVGLKTAPLAARESNSTRSIVLPSDPFSFQSGSGQEVANSYCAICHSADYIYMQPPHSQGKWTEIIKKMQQKFGCPIPDNSIGTLAKYLTNQNEIEPRALASTNIQEQSSSFATDKGNLSKGKSVYTSFCMNCHGTKGHGDGPVGQMLIPPAADLTSLGEKSDKEILSTIRNGRPGTAMPSWKNDLSVQDIADVLSYVRSFSQKTSKK
ncbi:MAG: c-type cytochrome [Nitrospirota bacterium]|nr:MAG: c-type cytochrome [Nitrospirota bacterium]